MTRLLGFAVISAGIAAYSWSALRRPRSHGFYRFFAFESLLGLVVLNLDAWYRDPFSPRQMLSWLLLVASLLLAAHGFYLLHTIGRPSGGFENTTVLVTRGAYRYIRHPLYSSLLGLGWGAFLKGPSLPGILLAVMATAFLVATARAEEGENLARFGAAYTSYVRVTKRFIPLVF